MPEGRIIVLTKAPRPGLAKSRIASELDEEAAAGIARVLVDRTLTALRGFPKVELRITPDDAAPEFESRRASTWTLRPQGEGDLGARMERAIHEALAEGESRVVLVGTDCPGMLESDIRDAFAGLNSHDVVLGPASDGGYWLLGLRGEAPELFREIPWSTSDVLKTTLSKAGGAGRSVFLLRSLADVDCLADWRRWLRDGPL